MFKDKFVFAQLVEFMDRNHFNYIVINVPLKSGRVL